MNWPTGRRFLAAALTLVFSLTLASGAHAAGWQGLGAISPPGANAGDPQVAAAPDGSMWVAWSTDTKTQIERIAPDGTAGPLLDLEDASSYGIALGVDSSGAATAAWALASGGVDMRTVQPDGTLGTTHAVGSSDATYPISMGMDGSGVATLAYVQPDSTTSNEILWAQRLQNGDLSGSPIQISSNANEWVEQAAIATDSAGDSVLTWGWNDYTDYSFPYSYGERVRQLKADGTLGTEHDLIGTQQYGDYTTSSVAISSSGDAYLAFVQMAGNPSGGDMKVAKLSVDDTLSDVGTLGPDTADGNSWVVPKIVVDSAGQATAVWADQSSGEDQLVSRRIQADGTIEPPLSDAPDLVSGADTETDRYTLVALPGGKAMAAWLLYDYPDYPLHASVIDPSSGPGPVLDAGDDGQDSGTMSGASDSAGDLFLALDRNDGSGNYSVHAAFYDVQGPTVDKFAAPAAGTAGDDMVFGGAATDRSGVQGYHWSFGDGGSADGSIADHTFTAPGTYTVTMTATDNANNATTRTRSVVVRSASSGGGNGSGGSGSGNGNGDAFVAKLTGLGHTLKVGRGHTLALHLPAQPQDAYGALTIRTNQGGAHSARLTTIGKRSFRVVRGKPMTLRVKLTARSVKLVKRLHGRLRATVRLTLRGFDGRTAAKVYRVTIRG